MRIASSSITEDLRLQDLYSYQILDTESDTDFNELVELVAQIYGCATAAISFVDKDRLWFKASTNMDVHEFPRNQTMCAHTIKEEILIVNDTQLDERFCNNKLITQEFKVRFYAGASIVSSAGYNLGTVCVFDQKPHELTAKQCKALKAVANQVSKLLELRIKNKVLKQQAENIVKEEKLLTQTVIQQQEKQRLTISRELHENIAQGLAATKLYLGMAQHNLKHPMLEKSIDTIAQLLEQVMELTHTIVPTTLQNMSFKNLLEILACRFKDKHALPIQLLYTGQEDIKPELSFAIYRMVEAALENVRLHASAEEVFVKVKIGNKVKVTVADNGVGVNMREFQKGPGLRSIVSVTEFYGGTVDFNSNGKEGCCLTLQIPLN